MKKRKCPKCGATLDEDWVFLEDCEMCVDVMEKMARSPAYAAVIKEFSLIRGYPKDKEGQASLGRAEKSIISKIRTHEEQCLSRMNETDLAEYKALGKKMGLSDDIEADFKYNKDNVLQASDWWYIPRGGIGNSGYIVNKSDHYVNSLGSGIGLTLSNCFWGHERGLYCDLVDFTFGTDTSLELARRLVRRFQSLTPYTDGKVPTEVRRYEESEIDSVVEWQFPVFKNHVVWIAIPEIRAACENEGLRFTASISELEITFPLSGRETTQKRSTA